MNSNVYITLLAVYAIVVTAALLFVVWQMKRKPPLLNRPTVQHTAETSRADNNDMKYQAKADEAMLLTQTFRKFVPRQFVEHFAKHGSDSLEIGRADEDNVAILFCDIRGFTGLSERMSPQELMNFLNSYFLRMNAPIHENNGFIDKFIGDAIMALFDNPEGTEQDKANDAIYAAVGLRHALSLYNQHRANSGYDAINIGIGVHFGPVILGTVGSDDRMDTTVIGDSVNIAQRLETLAPIYNVDIVVSAQLIATSLAEEICEYRFIDWVRVKGRTEPLKIYEILCHLPPIEKQIKLASAELIEQAVTARINKDIALALSLFQQVFEHSPDDSVITHHIKACEQLLVDGTPTNWDGAVSVNA